MADEADHRPGGARAAGGRDRRLCPGLLGREQATAAAHEDDDSAGRFTRLGARFVEPDDPTAPTHGNHSDRRRRAGGPLHRCHVPGRAQRHPRSAGAGARDARRAAARPARFHPEHGVRAQATHSTATSDPTDQPMRRSVAVLTLLLVAAGAARAQVDTGVPLERGRTYHFRSTVLDQTRVIDVSLPAGYATETLQRYPVVYVLDGAFEQEMAAAITRFYADASKVPPMIVVGIRNPDPFHD